MNNRIVTPKRVEPTPVSHCLATTNCEGFFGGPWSRRLAGRGTTAINTSTFAGVHLPMQLIFPFETCVNSVWQKFCLSVGLSRVQTVVALVIQENMSCNGYDWCNILPVAPECICVVTTPDSIRTMRKYAEVPSISMTLDAKLDYRLQECRGQRNFYISGFTLFLILWATDLVYVYTLCAQSG